MDPRDLLDQVFLDGDVEAPLGGCADLPAPSVSPCMPRAPGMRDLRRSASGAAEHARTRALTHANRRRAGLLAQPGYLSGPGVPPQIPAAIGRALERARRSSGSTPRSKRCPASVIKPSLRPRPMIASPARNARLEEHVRASPSVTAGRQPPITPAKPTGRSASVTTRNSASSAIVAAVEQLQCLARARARTPIGPAACRDRTRASAGRVRASRTG